MAFIFWDRVVEVPHQHGSLKPMEVSYHISRYRVSSSAHFSDAERQTYLSIGKLERQGHSG